MLCTGKIINSYKEIRTNRRKFQRNHENNNSSFFVEMGIWNFENLNMLFQAFSPDFPTWWTELVWTSRKVRKLLLNFEKLSATDFEKPFSAESKLMLSEIYRNREFYRTQDVRPPFTYASLIRQVSFSKFHILIHSADQLSHPVVITIFIHVVRKSRKTISSENSYRYWQDCGSGRGDHYKTFHLTTRWSNGK